MTKLNKDKAFFDAMRASKMLGPTLDTDEVSGLNAILKACGEANWPISFTAYALATAFHETAHTMQPISEYGGPKYFKKMYDPEGARPVLSKKHGNTTPGDGVKYHGRGYVQLTWKCNYARAEKELGVPLLTKPELAKDLIIAAKIMIKGMEQGWFSGKSCKTYLPTSGLATAANFTASRKIINGTDKAALITAYAVEFQNALVKGDWK